MGVSAAVFVDAVAYMRVSFAGIVFVFAFAMYQSIMRGVGETKMPLYVISLSVVLNLLLDPLLIFGWGSIPPLGVAGAAYATLITQAVSAVLGMYLLFSTRFGLQLTKHDLLPDWVLLKRLFRLGLPASIEQSMQALGLTLLTTLVSGFGTLAMAAFGLSLRVFTFVIIPAFGISMAASTLVAQSIGAGDRQRAEQIAVHSTWVSLLLLGAVGVVFFFAAVPIVHFFVPEDAELIAAGATVLKFMAASFVFSGVQLGLAGTFRGAGDTFITMLLATIGVWLVQLPIAYLLSKHTALGASGLWTMFPIAGFINTALALAYFKWGHWRSIRLTDASKLQTRVSEEILIEEGQH
jgi:putative MATE family efflux protein